MFKQARALINQKRKDFYCAQRIENFLIKAKEIVMSNFEWTETELIVDEFLSNKMLQATLDYCFA